MVTLPCGESNVTPSAAARTLSTSVEPAFSTLLAHRYTAAYACSIGSSVTCLRAVRRLVVGHERLCSHSPLTLWK